MAVRQRACINRNVWRKPRALLCGNPHTCGGGLDCGINETFSTSHGVEEKFLGREASQVAVLHKASRLRTIVVLHTSQVHGRTSFSVRVSHVQSTHFQNAKIQIRQTP